MEESPRTVDQQTGLRPWQHVAVFFLACAIVISRRPDALFHPQFWAEDGIVWFAQAYNGGWWPALFRTEVGYFQTLPRLGAALALLVPLASAPLVTNLIALAFQALPVNLLLGHRSREWGSMRGRIAFAAIYLALPNCPEICANITNAQWVLAFSAFLIVVGTADVSPFARAFDILILLLCGLTGPFCFFLLPVAIFVSMKKRQRGLWLPIAVLALCSAIQAYGLLVLGTAQRSSANLGASVGGFIRILAGNIYLGSLVGPSSAAVATGIRSFVVLLCIAIGCSLLMFAILVRSPLQMRLLGLFAGFILVAALVSPSSYDPLGIPKWQLIAEASGVRYWFFPSLLFLWCLFRGLQNGSQIQKYCCALLLVVLCFGVALRWRRPSFRDTHFAQEARSFEAAPAGTVKVFSENPDGWSFRLVRRLRY